MPCFDYDSKERDGQNHKYHSNETNKDLTSEVNYLKSEITRLQSRNHILARISCKVIAELALVKPDSFLFKDNDIIEWWEDHKKFDDERLRKELF